MSSIIDEASVKSEILLMCLSFVVAGCAATPLLERRLPAGFRTCFGAAERVLAPDGIERADRTHGRIETRWRESLAERTQGYLLEGHRVRRRAVAIELRPLSVSATAAAVFIREEERAPGGAGSIRWERVEPAAGEGEAILDRVAREARP